MKLKWLRNIYKPYWCLALLRVILVFIPQTSYIKPEEFKNSIEPIISRIFNFETNISWEYKSTAPVKSVGISYIVYGLSYNGLKLVNYFVSLIFNTSIITSYTLLVTPRIFTCLLSFLIDFSLYKICSSNNEKYRSKLILVATSYIIFIYNCRTFIVSIELPLFSLLLYYVSDSILFSNIIVKQHEYFTHRYNKSKSVTERTKFHKLKLFLVSHSYRNCAQISTLVVLGFFNNPLFLFYAIFPVFLWIYRGIGFQCVTSIDFHVRMFLLLFWSIPSIVILILIDSFYFGYITWGEIGMFDISIDNFIFPPLNVLRHFNCQHVDKIILYRTSLINVILLYNILGIQSLNGILTLVRTLFKRKYNLLPSVRSIKGLMYASIISPAACLIYFKQVDSMLLMPLLLPIIYLFGDKIYTDSDSEMIKVPKESRSFAKKNNLDSETSKHISFKIWLSCNLLFGFYFGFLHQGGMYSATKFISQEVQKHNYFNYNLIVADKYDIPHFMFMESQVDTTSFQEGLTVNKRIQSYNANLQNFNYYLEQRMLLLKSANISYSYKLYLLLPNSFEDQLYNIFKQDEFNMFDARNIANFYPHVSDSVQFDYMEIWDVLFNQPVGDLSFSEICDMVLEFVKCFRLGLYEIRLMK